MLSPFAYFNLTRDASNKIAYNPISMDLVKTENGKRCEARRWNGESENPVCYRLQEQMLNAVSKDDLKGIEKALRMGANVNGSYYQSYRPLYTAAAEGRIKAARLLIENGANPNQLEKWESTPLIIAAQGRDDEIVEMLLANGADVCHAAFWDDSSRPTALSIAREFGNSSNVRVLQLYGADLCLNQYSPF